VWPVGGQGLEMAPTLTAAHPLDFIYRNDFWEPIMPAGEIKTTTNLVVLVQFQRGIRFPKVIKKLPKSEAAGTSLRDLAARKGIQLI